MDPFHKVLRLERKRRRRFRMHKENIFIPWLLQEPAAIPFIEYSRISLERTLLFSSLSSQTQPCERDPHAQVVFFNLIPAKPAKKEKKKLKSIVLDLINDKMIRYTRLHPMQRTVHGYSLFNQTPMFYPLPQEQTHPPLK